MPDSPRPLAQPRCVDYGWAWGLLVLAALLGVPWLCGIVTALGWLLRLAKGG